MGKTAVSRKETKKLRSSSLKKKGKRAQATTATNALNGGKVTIGTVTLADIKKAAKSSSGEAQRQRQLVRVPSKNVRTKLLEEAADAIAAKESLALPPHGGRPWRCEVKVIDSASASKGTHKKKQGPLFRWFRGKLELACLPHILEKIEVLEIDEGKKCPYLSSDEDTDDDDDDELAVSKNALQERTISTLSTLAWNDPDHPIPNVERIWESPDKVRYFSRKAAMDHANELLRRDKLIDRVLHGHGAKGNILKPFKPTKAAALEAGYYRFLRDGLWVVGQEEDWQEEREDVWVRRQEKMARMRKAREEAARIKKQEALQKERENNGWEENVDQWECGASSSSKDMQTEHCDTTATSETKGDLELTEKMGDSNASELSNAKVELPHKVVENVMAASSPEDESHSSEKGISTTKDNRSVVACVSPVCSPTYDNVDDVTASSSDSTEPRKDRATNHPPSNSSSAESNLCNVTSNENSCDRQPAGGHPVGPPAVITPCRPRHIVPSTHWRLTQKQIDLCYNAAVEHYEKVMYTVKARALHAELADGFDLLRERGRGRFDMELPAFDDPKFSFLTDLDKASWMPVVRKILGEEVALVHKGAFLSLPGSEMQIYHQDGPHLTTKYQKPCHAVNVFIPLVDLTPKNGPTEFCLGTHILDYDYFAKEMVETPLAKAGTPIIFDYRLGHRGLGNSSSECRPLVYLTYSPAKGKEFKDEVNFSRKRYVKIGELIDKPLSREERAKRRRGIII